MIYVILIAVILACIAAGFWKEMKYQKKQAKIYKTLYLEAKDAWAEQSNAVRKKGIECKDWQKKFEDLKKKLKKARITI